MHNPFLRRIITCEFSFNILNALNEHIANVFQGDLVMPCMRSLRRVTPLPPCRRNYVPASVGPGIRDIKRGLLLTVQGKYRANGPEKHLSKTVESICTAHSTSHLGAHRDA